MLNAGSEVNDERLKVLDGVELQGNVNVDDAALVANVRAAIRRGHPQVFPQHPQMDRVLLVGGGSSLERTLPELRDLYFAGAKVATLNGAYGWCVERNIRPSIQIVMDARPHNARFVAPYVPNCRYAVASQAHPDTWDAVADYPDVWIFHAAAGSDGEVRQVLDAYYAGQWVGIGGGTTVAMRGLSLLRTLGYMRFDLFGVDSCFLDGHGHAYAQPENDVDRRMTWKVAPPDRPDMERTFVAAPWMIKQVEDMLQLLRINGDTMNLAVHGDGLLAYVLRSIAESTTGDVSMKGD